MSFDEWKSYKLREIASVQTGPFGSQLHQKDYVSLGTPIITVEHLGENFLTYQNLPKVSHPDKERLKKYLLKEGDIVFSRVGSVDRRAYIRKEEEGWLFSGRCLRVRPTYSNLDSKFLSYYFGLESFKQYIRAIAVGSTMPSLNTTILSDIEIPLPPVHTQRRIASILSSLDDKIELNRQINQTLEAIAQALFKEWFVDFNFPGATGEMQDSELGKIPKGWKVKSVIEVGEVTDFVANGSFASLAEKVKYKDEADYAILIRLIDYNRGFNGDYVYINEDAYNFLSKSKLVGNEIIIANVGANAGQVFRTPKLERPMSLGPNSIMIKPSILSHYLYLLFLSNQGQTLIQGIITGSAQPKFNKTDFRNLRVLIPDEQTIVGFNKVYSSIDGLVWNNKSQNRSLGQLRDDLLPKLMKGELQFN